MKRTIAFLAALGMLCLLGSRTLAQDKAPAASKKAAHVIVNSSDIQWTDAPPILRPGAKMAVLQGDPARGGVYTIRLKAGDGYTIAPHWHPTTENITVISGTFNLGMGDKLDESKSTPMPPGGFASMPAKMHHYAWFKGETEVQVHGVGPFKLVYVNPADDPTRTSKK